jgi:hypothetical protein
MSTAIFDQDFVNDLLEDPAGFLQKLGVEPTEEVLSAIEDLRQLEGKTEILSRLATWKPKKDSTGRVDLIFP